MTYITRRQRKELRKKKWRLFCSILISGIVLGILGINAVKHVSEWNYATEIEVPAYNGEAYVEINNNKPYFKKDEINVETFEKYSELDSLGRCGVAYANISEETMPDGERGQIGSIKPSGWHTAKYPDIIEDLYLYNRCHLIAWCLSGENANEKNLITGTRYMNIKGMLPFEEKVAKYIDETGNHVLYRVTPIFEGRNLVASGVLLEAYSVEDRGTGIQFCVYCFNVQPGIEIDYVNGESAVQR